MAIVPEALPAVLFEAWRRDHDTNSPFFGPWHKLAPATRSHWEAVAKAAVEFITEERVKPKRPPSEWAIS